MSQLPLCPHCLEPVRSGYHGSCPNCGKSLENHNPEGALPLGTQLGGHYTVGEYQNVLLANTNNADAGFVTGRIKDAGYSYEMIDGDVDGGAYGD